MKRSDQSNEPELSTIETTALGAAAGGMGGHHSKPVEKTYKDAETQTTPEMKTVGTQTTDTRDIGTQTSPPNSPKIDPNLVLENNYHKSQLSKVEELIPKI